MRRFFFTTADRREDMVTLNPGESRHICSVLRMTPGGEIELCDGSSTLYHAEITKLGERVEARIISSVMMDQEEHSSLRIYQGMIKLKKMELLLQKCTELGVHCFTPMLSSRCQGNLVRQWTRKEERWCRIIEEACKQCLRPQLMELTQSTDFDEIIAKRGDDSEVLKLLFYEREKNTRLADLSDALGTCRSVWLMLGPEGGFTEEEITRAEQAGWRTVGLGQRVLRAETASIATVAIVQSLLGNM